jgi:hypothetical protein
MLRYCGLEKAGRRTGAREVGTAGQECIKVNYRAVPVNALRIRIHVMQSFDNKSCH